MNTDFCVIGLPYVPVKRKPQKIDCIPNVGCKDWNNCLTCPKNDCDWQPGNNNRRKTRNNYYFTTYGIDLMARRVMAGVMLEVFSPTLLPDYLVVNRGKDIPE